MSNIITLNDIDDSDFLYLDYLIKSSDREQSVQNRLKEKLEELFGENVFPSIIATVGGLSYLNRNAIRDIIDNEFGQVESQYQDALYEEGMEVAQVGANRTIAHLQQAGQSVSYMDVSDRVEGFIRQGTFEASQQTMERMKGDVLETLSGAINEGKGIDEATEMLRDQFDNMQDYELERIARTEIHSYANESKFVVEQELGVEFHQWLTNITEATRGQRASDWADHIEMNGQIVRVGDEFSNGLTYPGDKSGSPEEYINCLCDLVPFIMPEGKRPPVGQPYFYESDLLNVS